MPIVTISREYGAGGLTVGKRVADLLGLDFFDAALIEEAARRLRVPADAVRRWDERREGLMLRLLRAMRSAHPEYSAGGPWPDPDLGAPDPDRVRRATLELIGEIGVAGNAVIVGRGGAFTIPAGPAVHHFRIIAPRERRIAWLRDRGAGDEDVARSLDQVDRDRVESVRHAFGVDPRDPNHYCLVVNTSCLPPDAAADLLAEIAAGRRPCAHGAGGV